MGKYWCKTCSTFVDENNKKVHESSPKHQGNIQKVLQKLKSAEKKQKEEHKLVEKLIADANEDKEPSTNPKPKNNVYGYREDSVPKSKVKKDGKKEREEEKEEDGTVVGKWEVVENVQIASEPILGEAPLSIKKRKLTVSEKEIKNWDLTENANVDLPSDDEGKDDDDTGEDLKAKITFKRRKPPIKKTS